MYKVLLIKFNDVYSPVLCYFGQMTVLSPWTLVCSALCCLFGTILGSDFLGVGCAEEHGANSQWPEMAGDC